MFKWKCLSIILLSAMLFVGKNLFAEDFFYNISGEDISRAICNKISNNPPLGGGPTTDRSFSFSEQEDTWRCYFKFNNGIDEYESFIPTSSISDSCEYSCGGENNCLYNHSIKTCSPTMDYLKKNPNHPYNNTNTQNLPVADRCINQDDCLQGFTCSTSIINGRAQSYKSCYENSICQNDSQCLATKRCSDNLCTLRSIDECYKADYQCSSNKDCAFNKCFLSNPRDANTTRDKYDLIAFEIGHTLGDILLDISNIINTYDGLTNTQIKNKLQSNYGDDIARLEIIYARLVKMEEEYNDTDMVFFKNEFLRLFINEVLAQGSSGTPVSSQTQQLGNSIKEVKNNINNGDVQNLQASLQTAQNVANDLSSLPILSATPIQDGLNQFTGTNPGIRTEGTLIGFFAQIVRWALGLIGTVFFGLTLFSGFNYMTAGGDSNKAKESLSSISNATIGLIIIIGSFLISNYIISAIIAQ